MENDQTKKFYNGEKWRENLIKSITNANKSQESELEGKGDGMTNFGKVRREKKYIEEE